MIKQGQNLKGIKLIDSVKANIEEKEEDVIFGVFYINESCGDVVSLFTKDRKLVEYGLFNNNSQYLVRTSILNFDITMDKEEFENKFSKLIEGREDIKVADKTLEDVADGTVTLQIQASSNCDFETKMRKLGLDYEYAHCHGRSQADKIVMPYEGSIYINGETIESLFYNGVWHDNTDNNLNEMKNLIHEKVGLSCRITEIPSYFKLIVDDKIPVKVSYVQEEIIYVPKELNDKDIKEYIENDYEYKDFKFSRL